MERTIRTHRVITEVDTTWGYETQVQAKKTQKNNNKQTIFKLDTGDKFQSKTENTNKKTSPKKQKDKRTYTECNTEARCLDNLLM